MLLFITMMLININTAIITIVDNDGGILFSGSSTEVTRRQTDGNWLYIMDHAMGSSLPSMMN